MAVFPGVTGIWGDLCSGSVWDRLCYTLTSEDPPVCLSVCLSETCTPLSFTYRHIYEHTHANRHTHVRAHTHTPPHLQSQVGGPRFPKGGFQPPLSAPAFTVAPEPPGGPAATSQEHVPWGRWPGYESRPCFLEELSVCEV